MPMVWYIPPLSPVVDALRDTGHDGEDAGALFGALDSLRIPIEYLAELFTAGDVEPVRATLEILAAMRSYMRDHNLGQTPDPAIPASVGMTEQAVHDLYRLLAIAKYEDRYVIPSAHTEAGRQLEELACSLDYEGGPGGYDSGPFGEASGRPVPVAVETFHALQQRQRTEVSVRADDRADLVHLLNWDGRGVPLGMPTVRAGVAPPHGAGLHEGGRP
jgi:nitrate reductase beta subunit